jgi:dipeptidyl aminopeptidase/acylaminoacyl peptidase
MPGVVRVAVRAKNLEDDDAQMSAVHVWSGTDLGYRILKNEKTGRDALYRYDFAKRERGELVYDNPKNDIEDFDLSEEKGELVDVSYNDDQYRVHWFDKDMGELQASLDKSVGNNRQAWGATQNRDRSIVLVHVGSASDLGSYYLYQIADGAMHRLAYVNDKLLSASLATPRYVSYKARDGVEIPAYLTLPVGRDPRKLPLIILPHGGPYGVRDDGSFDTDVQFLANRGYAVLQPQYRGSSSYGDDFYQKGRGQWGRAMQDDLDDGMDWLAKDGVIDAKRVCIVGSSYGGYAAQWGRSATPNAIAAQSALPGCRICPACSNIS